MIKGTSIRPLKKNCDDRGYFCELIRADGDYYYPFTMCYCSATPKGVIRAWHRHPKTKQRETLMVIQGTAKMCVYDEKTEELDEHLLGEDDMIAVTIDGGNWHGFKAISDKPVILLNFPDRLYDYKNLDKEVLPYNTDKIPYNWDSLK